MTGVRLAATAFAVSVLSGCAPSTPASPAAPDLGKVALGSAAMVSTASPYASEAGLQILRAGGNAVDAAVAAAFAVGVVEPQMSGLGGGGGMLIWLQDEERAEYLDFYAAQPLAAFSTLADPSTDTTTPLRGTGVPGTVAGLLEAHQRFGRLSRATVMAPAIRLAADGFAINRVLADMMVADSLRLSRDSAARSLLWSEGLLGAGDRLRNPELASVLRAIAERGTEAFYQGAVGAQIVAAMRRGGHPVTLEQFAEYRPQWKRPLCTTYRGRAILSAPPPQTGIVVLHMLELLEDHDIQSHGLPTQSADALSILASALRAGFAVLDMNGDPRWKAVPANGIVSERFAEARRGLVSTRFPDASVTTDAQTFDADLPPASCAAIEPYAAIYDRSNALTGSAPPPHTSETTHLSVVDRDGNAVALTPTNSSVFGAKMAVAGFFLNNSGQVFRVEDFDDGLTRGWYTRTSTIAPTIVLRRREVEIVIGAPGSLRIPSAIAQSLMYLIDFGLTPLDAVRMPRVFPDDRSTRLQLEPGFAPTMLQQIRARGWAPASLSSGYARLYVVARAGSGVRSGWIGVADPRHDGQPRGY